MKFHYFVTINLPDELFPPSPTAHPDDSPKLIGGAMAEGLRRMIPTGGILPCVGGGTSWAVEQVHRQIGVIFDKAIEAGHPPVMAQFDVPKSACEPRKVKVKIWWWGPLYVVVAGGITVGWSESARNALIRWSS